MDNNLEKLFKTALEEVTVDPPARVWTGINSRLGGKQNRFRQLFIYSGAAVSYTHLDVYKRQLWNSPMGIYAFFEHLESKKYKIQNRVMIARYTGKTKCPVCHGTRLKKEASYVQVGHKAITDLVDMPISELKYFFERLSLSDSDSNI